MFLYYVPKGTPEEIQLVQIGYAFDSKAKGTAHKQAILQGPGGNGEGILVANRTVDRDRVKFVPDKQYWRKIPQTENLWVGMYRGDKLTPSELQRPELVQGVQVELADGTTWQCAHARKFLTTDSDADTIIPFCPLPRTLDMDDDGKWVPTKIAPQYRRLADLAEQYRQASYEAVQKAGEGSAGVITFTFEPIDDLAIAGLQANYRIGPAELAFFDSYDVPTRKRLIAAIMDDATFEAWQKKRTDAGPAGSTTFDGADNSTQAETA
jgi:hypothetical protein